MKQLIVLLCSLMLGAFLVSLIMGENGLTKKTHQLWGAEYELRSSVYKEWDEGSN